jgi:O-antigen/teichoic acid export membrane protein
MTALSHAGDRPAGASDGGAPSNEHLVNAARSGAIGLLGSGVAAVAGLLLNVVIGRSLGAVASGVFFVVVAVVTVTSTVARSGADTGLVWMLPRLRVLGRVQDTGRAIGVAVIPVLVAGAIVSVATFVAAPALAARIVDPDRVSLATELLRLAAPFTVLAALVTVLAGGLRGLGSIVSYTVVQQLIVSGARPIVVVVTSAVGLGLLGAMWAWCSPLLAGVVLASVLLGRRARVVMHATPPAASGPAPSSWRELGAEFWKFSSARSVSAILESGIVWADVIIVGALTGSKEAGIYAAASRFVTTGTLVEAALRVAMGPLLSARLAAHDLRGASELYQAATQWIILLSWPLFLGIGLYAPAVLDLFGHGFRSGATALTLLCASMLVAMATGNSQTVLLMSGRSLWQLGNKAAVLALNLALNLLLVPRWGINGAAVAWSLTILVDSAAVVLQVRYFVGVRLHRGGLVRAMGVSLLSFGVIGGFLRLTTDLGVVVTIAGVLVSSLVHLALLYLGRRHFDADVLSTAMRRGRSTTTTPSEEPL